MLHDSMDDAFVRPAAKSSSGGACLLEKLCELSTTTKFACLYACLSDHEA